MAAKRIFVYNSFGEYGKVVCVCALQAERPECRNIFSRRRLGEAFPPKLQKSFQKKSLESVTQWHDTMTYPCSVDFHEGFFVVYSRSRSISSRFLKEFQRLYLLNHRHRNLQKVFFCGAKVFSNLSNGFFCPRALGGGGGGISFER